MKRNVIFFVIFNVVLVGLVGWGLLRPAYDSYGRLMAGVRLMEGRERVYVIHHAAFAENTTRLLMDTCDIVLYDALTDVLAGISQKARDLGLREIAFTAAVPLVYNGMADMRVSAVFEGCGDAVMVFVQGLEGVFITGLRKDFGEPSRVLLAFSVLGMKE